MASLSKACGARWEELSAPLAARIAALHWSLVARGIFVGVGLVLVLGISGCETTGNPREGGLFGWSESKAKVRQAEKRQEVEVAEAAVEREKRRGTQLSAASRSGDAQVAAARSANARTMAQLSAREAAVSAKASQLEAESPTAATASRARRLKRQVETVIADRTLTDIERVRQLRQLEAEIDAARAELRR